MARITMILPGVYQISLGVVNAYLVEDDGLTLIDTGSPGQAGEIIAAMAAIGRRVGDLDRIVVTHCHADHSGGAAELRRASGAAVYMHPIDAAMVREGKALRPLAPAPGLLRGLLYRMLVRSIPETVEACEVEKELGEGRLSFAGIEAVRVPGHCEGQIALLWPKHGGVLLAADAAMNMPFLGLSIAYEDLGKGIDSLRRLARLEFHAVVFGHGAPILNGAAKRFRARWGALSR
jgi:glyoxylase-like metal-dependent hydrolase (beta-lactamase superfamily II)